MKHFAIICLFLCLTTLSTSAQVNRSGNAMLSSSSSLPSDYQSVGGQRFGIGLMLGEPTGFNGKYWLTRRTAIDGALVPL
jgi:hypothetical protein